MKVKCTVKRCPLRGHSTTQIKVVLIEHLTSEIPVGDEF
jgi:hypothetical protein